MASTSPYDGRPSDHPPDLSDEVSFVRTIPPPAKHSSRLRLVARTVWEPCKRLFVAALGGGSGVFAYFVLNPQKRYFQPFPPWSSEAYIIFSVFLFFTTCTWLVSRRKR